MDSHELQVKERVIKAFDLGSFRLLVDPWPDTLDLKRAYKDAGEVIELLHQA